jgi:hypothetical protein
MWVVVDGFIFKMNFLREFTKETEHTMEMKNCKIRIVKKSNKPLQDL